VYLLVAPFRGGLYEPKGTFQQECELSRWVMMEPSAGIAAADDDNESMK
jgi:hypothetical protein